MERYRQENGTFCIDLNVNEFKQLYDGRDPSPFHERDLDENLVRYLVMSCEEIAQNEAIKIVMRVPTSKDFEEQKTNFTHALHQYFDHEVRTTENELKNLFRLGQISLLFGFIFLIICVFLAIKFVGEKTVFSQVIYEGLIIMGWVALWKPINIFLYDWLPYSRKKRIYKLLSAISIDFK